MYTYIYELSNLKKNSNNVKFQSQQFLFNSLIIITTTTTVLLLPLLLLVLLLIIIIIVIIILKIRLGENPNFHDNNGNIKNTEMTEEDKNNSSNDTNNQ